MERPKEFEDIFRGADLTKDEIRTLTWITGWERRTVENLKSAIQKVKETALSTLQAENEKLRAELEQMAACVYYKQGSLCRLGGADPANVCVMGPCPNQVSVWNLLTEMVLCPETLPKWVRPGAAMPPEGELVLVIVSGQPCRSIRLVYAVELAIWTLEDGWILKEYPTYEGAEIHFWAPIPELPEEARG